MRKHIGSYHVLCHAIDAALVQQNVKSEILDLTITVSDLKQETIANELLKHSPIMQQRGLQSPMFEVSSYWPIGKRSLSKTKRIKGIYHW